MGGWATAGSAGPGSLEMPNLPSPTCGRGGAGSTEGAPASPKAGSGARAGEGRATGAPVS
eukprot:2602371-Alexandrium_andersonii.AAC.1